MTHVQTSIALWLWSLVVLKVTPPALASLNISSQVPNETNLPILSGGIAESGSLSNTRYLCILLLLEQMTDSYTVSVLRVQVRWWSEFNC